MGRGAKGLRNELKTPEEVRKARLVKEKQRLRNQKGGARGGGGGRGGGRGGGAGEEDGEEGEEEGEGVGEEAHHVAGVVGVASAEPTCTYTRHLAHAVWYTHSPHSPTHPPLTPPSSRPSFSPPSSLRRAPLRMRALRLLLLPASARAGRV